MQNLIHHASRQSETLSDKLEPRFQDQRERTTRDWRYGSADESDLRLRAREKF